MSLKNLLFAVGALALAACDNPSGPKTVDVEAMAAGGQPPPRLLERIAFMSMRAGDYEIYAMNPDGSGLVRLTNSPGYDADPAFSPDMSKIAFTSFREGTYCCGIYLMNASDGSGVARLTTGRAPTWSPDGSKIAFTRDGVGGQDIWVMNVTGSGVIQLPKLLIPIQLTNTPGDDEQPAWSPDGSKMAFASRRDCNQYVCFHEIYVMNASDGSGVVRLTADSAYAGYPAWSPDGSKIAFSSNYAPPWNDQIYVMNADGSGRHLVAQTNTGFWDYDPTWSPDGTKIAFTSRRDANDGNDEIYAMNASDGSGVVQLTNSAGFDGQASWARRRWF